VTVPDGVPPFDDSVTVNRSNCSCPNVTEDRDNARAVADFAFTGVTAAECADRGDVPAAFVAVTTKVYVVPFTSPSTSAVVPGVHGSWHEICVGVSGFEPAYGVTA
jgi:hypothetical protein